MDNLVGAITNAGSQWFGFNLGGGKQQLNASTDVEKTKYASYTQMAFYGAIAIAATGLLIAVVMIFKK